jgi:hypothetical protein
MPTERHAVGPVVIPPGLDFDHRRRLLPPSLLDGPRPGHPLLPSLFLVFPIVQFLSFGVRVTIFVPLVPGQ